MDCQIGKAVFRWLLLSKPAKQSGPGLSKPAKASERSPGLSQPAKREPLLDIVNRNLSEDVSKRHFVGSPFHPFRDAVPKDGISVSDMITLCSKSRIVETYIFDVPAMENYLRQDVASRRVAPGIHLIYSSEFELISIGKHCLYFGETGPRFCNLGEVLLEAKKFAVGGLTAQRSEIVFNVDDTFSLPL